MAASRYKANEEFRRPVEDTFRIITPQMVRRLSQKIWRRVHLCVRNQGARADLLDTHPRSTQLTQINYDGTVLDVWDLRPPIPFHVNPCQFLVKLKTKNLYI